MSELEVYDYLANERLRDRLTQTFLEMNVELRVLERGVGIDGEAKLPPGDFVSAEEIHAAVSLSEILGYAIASDMEQPGGLRLLEWVRGYAVLKELGQQRLQRPVQPAMISRSSSKRLIYWISWSVAVLSEALLPGLLSILCCIGRAGTCSIAR
jgi:hypothetical protein